MKNIDQHEQYAMADLYIRILPYAENVENNSELAKCIVLQLKISFHNNGAFINTFFTKLLSLVFKMAFGYKRFGRRSFGGLRRASQSGTRRFNVMIPTAQSYQMTVGSQQQWSNLSGSCPYFKYAGNTICQASLIDSILYRTYCQLYDQVKINAVTAKISIMSNLGTGGICSAVKLVTMWDRDVKKTEMVDGVGIPNTTSIQTGSESQSTLLVNNSKAIVYRSIRASDVQERTTFHDCSWEAYQTTGFIDSVWKSGAAVGFCPGLWFALMSSSQPGATSTYVFDVALEMKWYVTFRNPKFGLSAGASKGEKFTELATTVVGQIKDESEEEETEKVEETPVLKKKKVVYEEETIPDDEPEEDDEESQEPLTQPFKSPMKKAGKKSSS